MTNKKGQKIKRPLIKTIHPVFDLNGNQLGTRSFDLALESSGTLRFLSFIQGVLSLLERGRVFVIDELSARLHPLLTKFIVAIRPKYESRATDLHHSRYIDIK